MLRCQPGMVSLCTLAKPAAVKRLWKSAAPSKEFTLRHRCRYSVLSRVCRQPDGMMIPQQTAFHIARADGESRTEYS
jgi:hypothetical protein